MGWTVIATLTADVLRAAPTPAIPPSPRHLSHISHPIAHLASFVKLFRTRYGGSGFSLQEDFFPCIMPTCRGAGAFKREAHVFCGGGYNGLSSPGKCA